MSKGFSDIKNLQYYGNDPQWKVRTAPEDAKEWKTIGQQVCNIAESIFIECGAERDFCVQDNSRFGTVVFGSVNRVIWNVATGFSIDEGYCNPEFIERFPEAKRDAEDYF